MVAIKTAAELVSLVKLLRAEGCTMFRQGTLELHFGGPMLTLPAGKTAAEILAEMEAEDREAGEASRPVRTPLDDPGLGIPALPDYEPDSSNE